MTLSEQTRLGGGRYCIRQFLGRGGFGASYLAWDDRQQAAVVLKEHLPWGCERQGCRVLPGSLSEGEYQESLRRFRRECQLLQGLSHPGIVACVDFLEENATAYLCMEWVDGESLVAAHPVAEWLPQVAEALAYLHGHQLVHGDLKLSNILRRPDGSVVLIDFGNCRPIQSQATTAIVSHGYSPPEFYSTRTRWDSASDIYSLAACVCEAGWGDPPPSALERLGGARLPEGLPAALQRALELDPKCRYSDVRDFCRELLAQWDPARPQVQAAAPKATLSPPSHRGWIHALTVDPNRNRLASGGEDKQVSVWHCEGGHHEVWGTHQGWVRALEFLPDGRLVSLGGDRQLCLWRGPGQSEGLRLPAPGLSLAHQGEWLWAGDESGRIHQVALDPLRVVASWQAAPGALTGLDVQGEVLACAGGGERIALWFWRSGELLERLKGHRAPVRSVCFQQDRLFSGGVDRRLLQWDWREGQFNELGLTAGTIWHILPTVWGPVTADGAKQVLLWSRRGSQPLASHAGEVRALACLGGHLYSAGQTGHIEDTCLPP